MEDAEARLNATTEIASWAKTIWSLCRSTINQDTPPYVERSSRNYAPIADLSIGHAPDGCQSQKNVCQEHTLKV
jgi:hypothetical protein